MNKYHVMSMLDRLWSKVNVRGPDDCWLWTASLHGKGYGQFNTGRRIMNAHIVVYELDRKFEVPRGLEIDHLCHVRTCMNPSHLEAVTKAVNILRGHSLMAVQARQTHCVAGHELSGSNVYWYGKNKTHRMCRACKRRRQSSPEYLKWRRKWEAQRRAS